MLMLFYYEKKKQVYVDLLGTMRKERIRIWLQGILNT